MPLTPQQSSLIDAYYEARKPYNALLLDALAKAPLNPPREHPIKPRKTSSEPPVVKRPECEGMTDDEDPPGEIFRELVAALQQQTLAEPEEEDKKKKKKGTAAKK